MNPEIDVSVVIGFKDWGLERLAICIRELHQAFGEARGEVIVSDYGSQSRAAEELARAGGARYVYTPTDGTWSRSRALNAGFAHARGEVLVSTDADMIFSPDSMEKISTRIIADPTTAMVLQCRDLLPGWSADRFADGPVEWALLGGVSRLRPRWGMGGMFALHRDVYRVVRGFDERMQIYGGEDMDFAYRVRRAGTRIHWIDDPAVRMYHMWHPSSRSAADETSAGREAIRRNREIYLKDVSLHRNLPTWRHSMSDGTPFVSVVICTYNRADFLRESLLSVQWQTFQDFEIIVVDDGSDDHTQAVVEELAQRDPRIRYFSRPRSGIPASRNFGNSQARGRYIVIHDSDDLMAPRRIEKQLASIRGGIVGSYGGWADFQHEDGSLTFHSGRTASAGALLFAGRVIVHASLMVRADLARSVPYDESFTSGSDYNWVTRLVRSGAELTHSGHLHILRRLHGQQVTSADSANQKSAAHQTTFAVRQGLLSETSDGLRANYQGQAALPVEEYDVAPQLVARMLPDHLVPSRPVLIDLDDGTEVELPGSRVVDEYVDCRTNRRVVLLEHATVPELSRLAMSGAAWRLVEDHEPSTIRLLEMLRTTGFSAAAMSRAAAADSLDALVIRRVDESSDERLVVGFPTGSGFDFLAAEYAGLDGGAQADSVLLAADDAEVLLALTEFLGSEAL